MIDPEHHKAAYLVGLDHHDGKFGITEAVRRLRSKGLNANSAASLVYDVSHLLNGERYTRALSVAITDDYLTWIRRDRDEESLESAINALSQHIEYYETKRNTHRPGLRALVEKHTALLHGAAAGAIKFEWKDRESRGYIDILPLALFAVEGKIKAVIHTVLYRKGEQYQAKCDITIRTQEAELDFRPYRSFNTKQGMLLGVARLRFEDSDRTSIAGVAWMPEDEFVFKKCPFEIHGFVMPPAPPYEPPKTPAGKSERMVRERPGQAVFRRNLKAAYGNRCCISGCSIAEVLEGAHIDPYIAPKSDNLRNGLLLRSDLHTLFDHFLIAIDPATFVIHVAEQARGTAGYTDLDGVVLKFPTDPSHHPDLGALKRHWVQFQTKHPINAASQPKIMARRAT